MYKPSEAERADPRLYSDNVRALMSRELGAPMVDVGTREEFVLKSSGVVVRAATSCTLLSATPWQRRGIAAGPWRMTYVPDWARTPDRSRRRK